MQIYQLVFVSLLSGGEYDADCVVGNIAVLHCTSFDISVHPGLKQRCFAFAPRPYCNGVSSNWQLSPLARIVESFQGGNAFRDDIGLRWK